MTLQPGVNPSSRQVNDCPASLFSNTVTVITKNLLSQARQPHGMKKLVRHMPCQERLGHMWSHNHIQRKVDQIWIDICVHIRMFVVIWNKLGPEEVCEQLASLIVNLMRRQFLSPALFCIQGPVYFLLRCQHLQMQVY